MNPLDRVKGYCDAAGMKPDAPLRLALVLVVEAASEAREAAKTGARGLTPEGELQLVQRISEASERHAAAIVQRLGFGLMLKMGLLSGLLAGGGYVAGSWSAGASQASIIEGAGFMAQLTELNDPRAMRDYCLKHSSLQRGGTACELPMVWVQRRDQ